MPRKDGGKLPPSIQQLSKLSQLQYELVSKGRYIERLKTENKLMRESAIFNQIIRRCFIFMLDNRVRECYNCFVA